MRIVQDPVGTGIEPTELIVEYHISAEQLQAVALPASEKEVEE